MTNEQLTLVLKLAEFAALMQGGSGLKSKAPTYLLEKWETVMGDGMLLDGPNGRTFLEWKAMWLSMLTVDGGRYSAQGDPKSQ